MDAHSQPLRTGKLPQALLCDLLQRYGQSNQQVLVGPAVGEDATAIALREGVVVAGMDPITFATDEIGWYVVHVNANDVAVMGANPRWFLVTFLLPEGLADTASVEEMFRQVASACQEVGAGLVGGHTEVTYDLNRPLAIGVMLGEVSQGRLVHTGGAQAGDSVILARGIPIEGTAIIARERRDDLLARGVNAALVERAADFLYSPGISVVQTAQVATRSVSVHAMHDPTEGGLLAGLWELAEAAGLGIEIDLDSVPVLPEGRVLCEIYGLNPYATIASGALVIACAAEEASRLIQALQEAHIPAQQIGHMLPDRERRVVHQQGEAIPLVPPEVDEIVKLFA